MFKQRGIRTGPDSDRMSMWKLWVGLGNLQGAGIVMLKSIPFVFLERRVRQWFTQGKNKELFFSVSLQSPDSLLPAFQRSLPLTKPQGRSSCHRHASRFSTWCCTLLPSGADFRELLGLTLSSSLGLPTPALSGLASIHICRTVG